MIGGLEPIVGYPKWSGIPSRRAGDQHNLPPIAKLRFTVRQFAWDVCGREGSHGLGVGARNAAGDNGPERREGVPQEREADAQDVEAQAGEAARRQGAGRHRGGLAKAPLRRLPRLSEDGQAAGHLGGVDHQFDGGVESLPEKPFGVLRPHRMSRDISRLNLGQGPHVSRN